MPRGPDPIGIGIFIIGTLVVIAAVIATILSTVNYGGGQP